MSRENAWVLFASTPSKTYRQAEANKIVNKINTLHFSIFYAVKNEDKPLYLPDPKQRAMAQVTGTTTRPQELPGLLNV